MKLSLDIPTELEKRLRILAEKTGKEPGLLMQEVLEDTIIDLEDLYLARDTLDKVKSGEVGVRSFDEWEREFDAREKLDD